LFLLCWTPVVLLSLLAVCLKRSALELAIYGFVYAAFLAAWAFKTPWPVIWLAAADGLLTTVPLLAVVFLGILFSQLLLITGSLERLVAWLLSGLDQSISRHLLITLGLGNFFEGAGIIAEPMVAPMLLAAGVMPAGAAALSIIGYAGVMSVELAGIIITVLALVTGLPFYDLGVATAWLSIPGTLLMAVCIPFFLPERRESWRRLPLILGYALLVSVAALAAAIWLGVAIAGMAGGLVLTGFLLWRGNRAPLPEKEILRHLAPFGFILIPLLLVNTIPWLQDLTMQRLVLTVRLIPVHAVTLTPFFSPYLYLALALVVAGALLKTTPEQWRLLLHTGVGKGWRALAAMGLFGAMGQVIAYSGYSQGFGHLDQAHNIPFVLATGIKQYTGSIYPLFVPLLGWVGTFLTGYGVASLMLFGELQVQAAPLLGVSATMLAAGLSVGAAVGSISSPFKIAIAAPMCGAVGQEGLILRLTIPLGLMASLLLGAVLLATA
ncbi:MAG TPA: L-lactate permease, partial [Thermodesulfobacteriota bacterium]|nr:L-lactate permease [Thermodesulfobacteriota bacterium]